MEIQLGLRSTEADGRAPGTGRPSTSAPERNATGAALEARRSERVARRESETEHAAFEQRLRERQAQEESRGARKASANADTEDSTAKVQEPPVERRGATRSSTGRAEAKPSDAANQPSTNEPHPTPSAAAPSPAVRAPKVGDAPLTAAAAPTSEVVTGLPLPTLLQAVVVPEAALAGSAPPEPVAALLSTAGPAVAGQPTAGAPAVGATPVAVSVPHMETLLQPESVQGAETDPSAAAKAQEAARAPARERAADVLRQIGVQLSPQMRQAVIDLYPRELGRIHIRMSVQDGAVRASVRAERPETLESLEQHLPELRALLAGAGLEAQDLSLSLGFDNRRGAGREAHESNITPATAELRPATALELGQLARRVAHDGGVDTFA